MLATIIPLFLQKIGATEIILIIALILVFFGGKKIPELMRGMGRGMKEFKDAVNKDYTKEVDTGTEVIEEKPARKAVAAKPAAKKSAASKKAN